MAHLSLLPRLLRLMAAVGTMVLMLGAAVHGWKHQLTQRLGHAVTEQDYGTCVTVGEQLARLESLELVKAEQLAHCRRALASHLWIEGESKGALDLMDRLIHSPQMVPADQLQLSQWVRQHRDRAVESYRRGHLSTAVALLLQLSEQQEPQRDTLIESLQVRWNLNRQLHERAVGLRAEQRWWEALDTINRLDHPWWRVQAQPIQDEILQATQALTSQGLDRDGHNSNIRHNVPIAELDRRVRLHVTRGMDDWRAYVQACHELGGMVAEYGPESVCRR